MFSGTQAQDCVVVDFTMSSEIWASEISWNLSDNLGNIVYDNGITYNDYEVVTETTCLAEGCYSLNLFDSFLDGWNGAVLVATHSGYAQTYTLDQGNAASYVLYVNPTDSCDVSNEVFGCTDMNASNYNPNASVDDGSCYYQNDTIFGCTDPGAMNYNPWATIDDGLCEYAVACDSNQVMVDTYVCVFSNGEEVGFEITDDAGNVVFSQMGYDDFDIDYMDMCLDYGVCYTATLTNLTGPFGWYSGYFWVNTMDGFQLITGTLNDGQQTVTYQFSVDGTCGEIYGCTDPNASNYNPDATLDDASCFYAAPNDLCADAMPLSNGTILIDNTGATENEGVYGECWNSGQGEGEQSSLWYSFTTPAIPVRVTIETSGDGTYSLTDTQFGLFTFCGGNMIACDGNSGDGLFSLLNFECGELETNTEYILIIDGYFGDVGSCLLTFNSTTICDDPIYGCTDPAADNYNPNATVDDGSCYYSPDSCLTNTVLATFVGGSWAFEVSFDILDENGNVVLSSDGVDFENGAQYTFFGCADDGCYVLNMHDTFGDGWNQGVISVNVNGADILSAVTMETGNSMSIEFGINDTTCAIATDLYGCTDIAAWNYNPAATVDDGSCYYDSTNYDCVAGFELIGIDQENDVVYLLNTSIVGPNAEYFWDFGDGGFSYEQLPAYQYAEGGTYMVCLTVFDALNCVSTYCDTITYVPGGVIDGDVSGFNGSVGWWINVTNTSSVGIDEIVELEEFTIYPVPSSDLLYVNFNAVSSEGVLVNITDLRGRVIQSVDYNPGIGKNIIELNLNELAEGSYILEAVTSEMRSVRRIEVMR